MQFCVFSDTHNNYPAVRDILLSHPDSDQYIFCGDGEYDIKHFLREYPEYEPKLIRVRGNCDFDQTLPLSVELPLPYGHKMLILHGHHHFVYDYMGNLPSVAKRCGADIVVFGHIHTRVDCTVDGVRLFNPGSAAKPRDGLPASFGLIDVLESGILTSHGDMKRSSYGMPQW